MKKKKKAKTPRKKPQEKANAAQFAIDADRLTWTPDGAKFESDTKTIGPAKSTVGQERAIHALRFGLEVRTKGFNIFVAGHDGTGRSTTVRAIVDEVRKGYCPAQRDLCYVNNFKDPDRPRLLVFPQGKGRVFQRSMEGLLVQLRSDLPSLLESDAFKAQLGGVIEKYRGEEATLLAEFDQKIRKQGFVLGQMKVGALAVPDLLPLIQGKPVPFDKLEELARKGSVPEEQFARIVADYATLHDELEAVLRKMREINRAMQTRLEELERETCDRAIRGLVEDLKAAYADEEAREYLEEVRVSLLDNLRWFKPEGGGPANPLAGLMGGPQLPATDPFLPYQVNVILDTTDRKECPVEVPDNPTYTSLFGAVELDIWRTGAIHTDFMKVKAGSFVRANGGYLILNARDVFSIPGVWWTLKRVLKTGRLEIVLPEGMFLTSATAMKPEAIDVDVKVVMIGEPWIYQILYLVDDEFQRIFRVKAEFDDEMPITRENLRHFVSVLTKIEREEKLLPVSTEGIAALLEQAVRGAHRRTRISTRFNDVGDIYRESSWIASRAGKKVVASADVRAAVEAHRNRHNLPEEKIQRMIDEGLLAIDVDGERVGEANGLAVYDLGQYAFGRPSRITATVSLGRAGIVNIEREAGLSGKIHDKGVLILTNFLRDRFGQEFPLSLTASLCFEQSYAGVEGDSASSTELYALLSALSGVPIRQGVAVTGSVDQRGRVQPIGGTNQKVEGFFEVCKAKGLSGTQGVLIPASNVEDLMLRQEVIEAVRDGRFHVWAVSTIDEGIEVLTGRPAKVVNAKATERLKQMAVRLSTFEKRGK